LESLVVKCLLRLRVASQKNLKAPVQAKSINDVGPDSATNAVGCLQKQETNAALLQPYGAAHTRQATTDNNHVVGHS
jgi:hypothetical protein